MTDARIIELAFIAFFKHVLVSYADISVAERLRTLEWIDGCAHELGPAAVAIIEPANTTFAQIVAEAIRVDPASEDGAACFAILEHPDTRASLLALNPSIAAAAELRRWGGRATETAAPG
jgi:hypothetical protein